jgi:hypothetical protein
MQRESQSDQDKTCIQTCEKDIHGRLICSDTAIITHTVGLRLVIYMNNQSAYRSCHPSMASFEPCQLLDDIVAFPLASSQVVLHSQIPWKRQSSRLGFNDRSEASRESVHASRWKWVGGSLADHRQYSDLRMPATMSKRLIHENYPFRIFITRYAGT